MVATSKQNIKIRLKSYDHRLIDGREAVSFLVLVKEEIEDPERMLIDI